MSSRVSPARWAAFDALQAVHNDDAYANLLVPKLVEELDSRDAGLATEISYGALRRQGSIDAVIDACSTREIDPVVRDVLRVGVYQLLFMRVPSHAAVDETVEMAKALSGRGASGFVNAVMRAASGNSFDQWCVELTEGLSDVERLAIVHSFPAWVIRSLMDAYRLDAARVEPLLAACNEPAEVSLVARPGQCDVDELLEIPGARAGVRSPLAVILPRGTAPGTVPAIRQQRAGVQDEGSQLVALALAEVEVPGEPGNWLDLCSGPGGKAAILAGKAAAIGARFTALEANETRARLVSNALEHAPGSPDIVVGDGRRFDEGIRYARILVDAPCSGLGALRRRPEARWRKKPGDLPGLVSLQTELLDHAADLVRPGGVIGYATCSPHVAETFGVVERLFKQRPGFELVHEPMLLRPDLHGTDGMFLALLRAPLQG